MAEEREAAEDWLAGICLGILRTSPFSFKLEEARGICRKQEVRDKITELAGRMVSEVITQEEGEEELNAFLKERYLPTPPTPPPSLRVAAPPKVRKIPRVAPSAPPEWTEMAERIFSDYPDLLAIASLGDIQRMYGPELGMTSRDLPYVADILDRMLAEMGNEKMKAPENVREYFVGWILAVCSSQIVEINVARAVDEIWSDIRFSIRHDRPDIFEEIEPVTYKFALEGCVMSNLGVEPEQMPKKVREAYEMVERRFG